MRTRDAARWREVDRLLRLQWSPEQIADRLKRERGLRISHEWIYSHILADRRAGGHTISSSALSKGSAKRCGAYSRREVIPNQVSIDARPAIVARRQHLGDWEGDIVIGRGHSGALVTLVECKARYALMGHVRRKTAAAVRRVVRQHLADHRVHTLTYDHAREFADHQGMATDLDARIFFTHPYASWARGLNENTNGLIHQYFPKQCRLAEVADTELKYVMAKLNHRPRKTLNFRTPHEVFFKTRSSLTVALQC